MPVERTIGNELLQRVPVEVVSRILQFVPKRRDLVQFALTCRAGRDLAYPVLYRHIVVRSPRAVDSCLCTLAASETNLAAFVRTFEFLSWVSDPFDDEHNLPELRWFRDAFNRMDKIEELICEKAMTEDLCVGLFSRPKNLLKSLTISFTSNVSASRQDPFTTANLDALSLHLHLPRLIELHLRVSHLHEKDSGHWELMHRLLVNHAPQLRYLSVVGHCKPQKLTRLITKSMSFPVLESLTGSYDGINSLHTEQIPNVKCLAFGAGPEEGYFNLRPLLPQLDVLCCSFKTAAALLNDSRTLNTLRMRDEVGMKVVNIANSLAPVIYCQRTLQELTLIYTHAPVFLNEIVKGLPELPALNTLTIRAFYFYRGVPGTVDNFIDAESLISFGRDVFPKLPRLTTLLIKETASPQQAPYKHKLQGSMQRKVLDAWSELHPSLNRVSFSQLFEWVRMEDGKWVYPSDVVFDPDPSTFPSVNVIP